VKILMVTPLVPHADSVAGGALVMFGQLQGLAARHEVTLATLAGADAGDQAGLEALSSIGVEAHPVWRARALGPGRWTSRLQLALGWLKSHDPLRALKFRELGLQTLIDELARKQRFDVLQIEDNAVGEYRYPEGVPTVFTEHEVRVPATTGSLEPSRWPGYQRRVWGRFDRLQVFTQRDAEAMQAMAPYVADRVRVNPFGVTVPPTAGAFPETQGEVVFTGGFYHAPNVDAAVWLGSEIFPALRRLCPDAHLTIVGVDPPPSVRALAGPAVTVTGRVPRVETFIERAAVVLAPLREGGGMRVKVLQALALGKAVVTTPLGAEGLAWGAAPAPLIVARDAFGIAQAAADLLADKAARDELGRRARSYVLEQHGWAAYVRRLEAIYAELGLRP